MSFHRQRGHQTGTVSPVGVVAPQYVGQQYADTTNRVLYEANGLTSTDWAIVAKDNYVELDAVSQAVIAADSATVANSVAIAAIDHSAISQAASSAESAAKANSALLETVSTAVVAADSATQANSIQILGIHTELNAVSDLAVSAVSAAKANSVAIKTNSAGVVTNASEASQAQSQAALMIPLTQRAQANGVATLGGDGKVPTSQLPDTILGGVQYIGSHDASTAAYPVGPATGDYYIVDTAGTISTVAYNVGDWMVYNGTTWDKIDNTDQVTSVNTKTGAVVLVASDVGAPTLAALSAANLAIVAADSATQANSVALVSVSSELNSVSAATVAADSATVANSVQLVGVHTELDAVSDLVISAVSAAKNNSANIVTNSANIVTNAGGVSQAKSQVALIVPGAPANAIQFNAGGKFTGDADLTWNSTTQVMDVNGELHVTGEISIKVYAQAAAPALTGNNHVAIWEDTDDGNASYLLYKKTNGTVVGVELT